METLIFNQTLTTCNCYKCGILFGMPKDFHQRMRDIGETFYCPAGHSLAYTESTVTRLEKALATAKRNTTYWEETARARAAARDSAQHQARALKGVITKVKKRIGNGVCPCCKRFFPQLSNHMKSQHPEYGSNSETNT